METYITVAFWMGVGGIIIRSLRMLVGKYPIIETKSLGAETYEMLLSIGFVVWSGVLLFSK